MNTLYAWVRQTFLYLVGSDPYVGRSILELVARAVLSGEASAMKACTLVFRVYSQELEAEKTNSLAHHRQNTIQKHMCRSKTI